jgi:hypothetical protein
MLGRKALESLLKQPGLGVLKAHQTLPQGLPEVIRGCMRAADAASTSLTGPT